MTFWNEEYKEHYHTPAGARLEAVEKYIVPSRLEARLQSGDVALLDVCFGLGYNSFAAMNSAASCGKGRAHQLDITALEMDRRVVGAAAKNVQPSERDPFDWRQALQLLHDNGSCSSPNTSCRMFWGDARYTVTKLPEHSFDLVFLDAFSTQRNSELWTVDFFNKLRRLMNPDAMLLTYCAAIPVRSGLMAAGFHVGENRARRPTTKRHHGRPESRIN